MLKQRLTACSKRSMMLTQQQKEKKCVLAGAPATYPGRQLGKAPAKNIVAFTLENSKDIALVQNKSHTCDEEQQVDSISSTVLTKTTP